MAKAQPGSVSDLLAKFMVLMMIAVGLAVAIGALIGAAGYAVLMAVLNLISYAWRRRWIGFEPFENEHRNALFMVCCGIGVVGFFIFLTQLDAEEKRHDRSTASVTTPRRWSNADTPYPSTTVISTERRTSVPTSAFAVTPTPTRPAVTSKNTQPQRIAVSPTIFSLSSPPSALAGTACTPAVDTRAVDRYGWLKCEVITGIPPLWMSTPPVLGYANPGDMCDSSERGIAIAPNGDDLWCVEYANPGWKWAFVR